MAPLPASDDYYLILEVESSATTEEITQSYKRLALKLHPDRNNRPNATQAFQKLGQAYETLKDDDERRKYDRLRRFGDTTPTPWTSAQRQQPDPWSQAREQEDRQWEDYFRWERVFRDMEARYDDFRRGQEEFMEQARKARAETKARAKATAETMRQRRQAEEKQRQREKEADERRCRHGGDGWWSKVTVQAACEKCGAEEDCLLQCPDCDMRLCAKCQCDLRPKMEPKKWKKAKKSKKTK